MQSTFFPREQLNWINPMRYNGGALTGATLSQTLSVIGATPAVLVLTQGQWDITANLTIPANVHLLRGGNARLAVASGVTLTLNCSQEGPLAHWLSGPGTVVFGRQIPEAYFEWFGGVADGTTDCTTAGQMALDSGADLITLLFGTYLGNWTINRGTVSIEGMGQLSELKALTADPCLTVTVSPEANAAGRCFRNFKLNGNARASHGVQYDVLFTADRWEGVFFRQVNRAINAPNSAIGARVFCCHCQGANYGVYIRSAGAFAINENIFRDNRFLNTDLVCFYLNGVDTPLLASGGNYFINNWMESCPGIGIFARDFLKSSRGINVVQLGWMEELGTGGSLDLDDEGATDARAIVLARAGEWAFLEGASPTIDATYDDTQVHFSHLKLVAGSNTPVVQAGAMLNLDLITTDNGGGLEIVSPLTGGRILSRRVRRMRDNRSTLAEVPPRTALVSRLTNLAAVAPGSAPGFTTVTGTGTTTLAPFTYQGLAVRTLDLPVSTDAASRVMALVEGTTYIMSFSVRSATGGAHQFRFTLGGTAALFSNTRTLVARPDEWTTFLLVSTAMVTGNVTGSFLGHADAPANFHLAMAQLVGHPTEADAYHYGDAGMFAMVTPDLQLNEFAAAMPTTGSYVAGTVVHTTAPTIDVNGWVLVAYKRLTTGSGHTLGVDWSAVFGSAQTIVAPTAPLTGTATPTLGTINTGVVSTFTITVTGATTTQIPTVSPTGGEPGAGLVWSARITATNTVTVRVANPTGGNIVTSNVVWTAIVRP